MAKRKFEHIIGELKRCSIPLCIGALFLTIGLIWSFFYCIAIGTVVLIITITYWWERIRYGYVDEYTPLVGCFLIVPLAILVLLFHGTRYVSSKDNYQHLYEDCCNINQSDVKCVTELEGVFYGTFWDCDSCGHRSSLISKQKYEHRKQYEREHLIDYLQSLIDELNNGADADDIEDVLIERYGPEYVDQMYDGSSGIPSRYR